MDQLTASFVLRYINRYLSTPAANVDRRLLEEHSYRRCAAYEIMDRIKTNKNKDGQIIVERFIREMFIFEHQDNNYEISRRFEIAKEVGEDILIWYIINRKEK